MKRKLVTIGYLLWMLAFLPTAIMVEATAGVPYFLAVYVFHWVNQWWALLGCCFYAALFFLTRRLLFIDDSLERNSLSYYFKLIVASGIVGSALSFIWCFGVMLHSTFQVYLFWMVIPAAFVTVFYATKFVKEARSEFLFHLADWCSYPKDKRILLRLVNSCEAKLRKDPHDKKAAAMLTELYKKTFSEKTIQNKHDELPGSHTDESHTDEGDATPGSGNHYDFEEHSDSQLTSHDDYFAISK